MKLYSYYRSSAAYRVRIGLNLKGVNYDIIPVHLAKGEQKNEDYANKNPQKLVPSLELDDGRILTQSIAILEYLEATYPNTPLLPENETDRAIVRAMVQVIASDIHPINNLRVLQYLTGTLGVSEEGKSAWYAHWIHINFEALERFLSQYSGQYAFGDTLSFADICLVPQVYNARRFDVDLSAYPNIVRIDENCRQLDAFKDAAPECQPDFSA